MKKLFVRSACAALTVLSLFVSTQSHADDKGLSLGLMGGIHAGGLIHNKSGDTDPVKGGLMGVTYGYQVGADVSLAFLWAKVMYNASNVWATDYASNVGSPTDVRYSNNTLTAPLMFQIKKNNAAVGIGAYYSHPLSSSDQRDSGLALGFKFNQGGSRLFAEMLMLGSFREQAQGGNLLQYGLNLGFRLH